MSLIRDAGFQTIINLAPHGVENSLPNEAAVVEGLGVNYIHIPVDFTNPTDADFDQFSSTLQSLEGKKTWVHCAANMRVSAFTYRYRRDVLKQDASVIEKDLHRIWEPFGVWQKFVSVKQ